MRRGSRVIVGTGLVGLQLAWLTAETLTPTARRRIRPGLDRCRFRFFAQRPFEFVEIVSCFVQAGFHARERPARLMMAQHGASLLLSPVMSSHRRRSCRMRPIGPLMVVTEASSTTHPMRWNPVSMALITSR